MRHKTKQLDFKGQPIFIGIDVHDKQWTVTSATQELMYKSFSQPPTAKALNSYLKKNFPGGDYLAVYEAGCFGFWIHRDLEALGIKTIVVNPADIPTTDKERKQKEDRRDSRRLVKSLRSNELKSIYIPSRKTQEDRQLIRIRVMLSKDIRRYKNRIKALLKYYGIPIPLRFKGKEANWSRNFIEWLKSIELEEPTGCFALNKLIEQCERIRQEILEVNRAIRKLSKTEPYKKYADLLISIPGIGVFISMVLLTEIENISRFKNLNKLASYIGLVPRTSGSGDNENVGDITPRAHKQLRTLLIEASWMTIKSDPALSLRYNELCQRMKKNRAIIIIAKKLLNRIRYVLKNEKEYVLAVVE